MRSTIPTRLVQPLAAFLVATALTAGAEPAAAPPPQADAAIQATPRPAPRLDPDTWARRNVDLLRRVVGQPYEGRQGIQYSVFAFSLQFNPLLMHDPHAAEVKPLVEQYRAAAGEDAGWVERHLALLSEPDAERLRQLPLDSDSTGDTAPGGKPRPKSPDDVVTTILNLPRDVRPAREPELIDQMESSARDGQKWGELAAAYYRLAGYALHGPPGPREASRYIDRLLEVVREHPHVFRDGDRSHSNTQALRAGEFAGLMLKAGRRADFDRLMRAPDDDVRARLAIGLVAALAANGHFDDARAVNEKHVRPVTAESADRLAAAFEGKVVLPPPPADGAAETPPAESRLRGAQSMIATGHAARGDVDTAGRMRIGLTRGLAYNPAGRDRLAPHEWSGLATRAAENGHADAARRAVEHAIEAMRHDASVKDDEREDKAAVLREAASLGDYGLVEKLLHTTRPPGAWARLQLAKSYRNRGDVQKARETLEEAIKHTRSGKVGSEMAQIAVELHALGEEQRAERLLLEAMGRIEGTDFGFGGTSDVVLAAVKMNRLDLLDRIYDQSGPDEKLLLCIVASRVAHYGLN